LQRRQRNEKALGVAPVHVPGTTVRTWPGLADPLIVGSKVLCGAWAGSAVTAAVAGEVAELRPSLLLAVTTTRSVCPTSSLRAA
jgi:hypothetical protein